MKTREWIFTIAIVILIQFIVQVGALIFSNDNNVLNYISFAGTIVSIILATIAIVYSFVQTISQQSASSNISNQVDKLITVVDQIHDSKKIINSSIEHLQRASEKLDTAIENQSNIHKEVKTISESFSNSDLFKNFQTETNSPQDSTENKNQYIDEIIDAFPSWANGTKLCTIYLFWGSQKKLSINEIVDSIATPIMKNKFKDDDSLESAIAFQHGLLLATFHTLNTFNATRTEDKKIKLHPTLEKKCRLEIESIKASNKEDFLKEIITYYEENEKDF